MNDVVVNPRMMCRACTRNVLCTNYGIFLASSVFTKDGTPLRARARRVYTHGAEFLIAAAPFFMISGVRCNICDVITVVCAEVTSRMHGEVFRNYDEKYAAFIQPLARGPSVMFRGNRVSLFSRPKRKSTRLSRKLRYLSQVRLHTTCTSMLRNYLRYYYLE